MRKPRLLLSAAVVLSLLGPVARASTIDLYDFAVSTSTGVSGDWQDVSTTNPLAIVNSSSASIPTTMVCCGDASGGTTPGLGAVNYTFTGTPGVHYTVTMYFDYDVAIPNFNEYGKVNNPGSAQSGISYEIFNANSTSGNIVLYGATGVAGSEKYGTSNGTNGVLGTTDNFLNNCTAASCNADVGMALTYSFTLGANQYAVLTADASTSIDPSEFSLETIHPVDANNSTQQSVFLTGSYVLDTSGHATPEPASWALLGTALLLFGAARVRGARRRTTDVQ